MGLKENIVNWIRHWFKNNGDENTLAVIGISGGKDSSVVAALCVEALGANRVVGVLMPNYEQQDIQDSYDLVNSLGINSFKVNIGETYESSMKNIEGAIGDINNDLVKGNLQARLRMSTLYAISQELDGRVSNNCNLSERFVGYTTLYGDDSGDFAPLANLTVSQVMKLGRELGLPKHLYNKTPIDGLENNLINGQPLSDEDVMGFKYSQLEEYIKTGVVKGEPNITDLIAEKHKLSEFKRERQNIDSFKM